MRRVFISHRNGRPEEVAFIEQLRDELIALDFEVLVDFERLDPGASLREDIYVWLGMCHAAIVLLTPEALGADSAWVPTESSILAWRKTLDPAFVLVPVLMPGVQVDHLRDHLRFRDLGLHDLLCVTHVDLVTTRAAIVSALATVRPAPRTPLEDLAEQIDGILDDVRDDFLDEALRLTGVEARRLPRGMARSRSVALAMLHAPLARTVTALEYLAPRLRSSTAVHRILEIVAPAWVDLNAARWIAYCAAMPSPRPAAVVNVRTKFGAEMYVRRACSRPPMTMWRTVSITSVHGETVFDDLATEIDAALQAQFGPSLLADPFDTASEGRLVAMLSDLSRRGVPVVVVARLPCGHADLVPSLQDRFPYLTFLFLSGDALPDDDCPVTLVRYVDPPLEAGRESAARDDYQAARVQLGVTSPA